MATPPFHYQHMFPLGPDKTEYYLLTKDYVSVSEFEGKPILRTHHCLRTEEDNSRQHPILMHCSPYSCSPYGEGFDRHFRTNLKNYMKHRYIIVFQDVRGRHKKEEYLSKYALSTKQKG